MEPQVLWSLPELLWGGPRLLRRGRGFTHLHLPLLLEASWPGGRSGEERQLGAPVAHTPRGLAARAWLPSCSALLQSWGSLSRACHETPASVVGFSHPR